MKYASLKELFPAPFGVHKLPLSLMDPPAKRVIEIEGNIANILLYYVIEKMSQNRRCTKVLLTKRRTP